MNKKYIAKKSIIIGKNCPIPSIINYLIQNVSEDELDTPPVSPGNQRSPGTPDSFLQQEFLEAIGSQNIDNPDITSFGDIQEFRATYNNPQPMYTPFDLDLNFFDPTNNFQQTMTEDQFRYHYPQNPVANLPPPQEFQIGNLGDIDFSNITPIPGSIFNPNSH